MGVIFFKVLWISEGGTGTTTDITNSINLDVKRGLESKTNIATLTIKNPYGEWNASSADNEEPFQFKYNDVIEIYIADSVPIATTLKGNSSQLKFRGFIQKLTVDYTENTRDISLECVDETTHLLNKVWSFDYAKADSLTPPQIAMKVIRENTFDKNNETGAYDIIAIGTDGKDQDGNYDAQTTLNGAVDISQTTITLTDASVLNASDGIVTIDNEQISYESVSGNDITGCVRGANRSTAATHTDTTAVYKSGYVQSKTEPDSGDHLADGSAFGTTSLSSNFIPVYEWLKQDSARKNLFDTSGNIEKRSYTFYVDKFKYYHWFYPYNTADHTLTEGENRITSIKLTRSKLKAFNMIIFDCGPDCYGRRIINYAFNENTVEKELKIKFETYNEISTTLKQANKALYEDDLAWSGTVAATTNYKDDNAFPDSWPSDYKASWSDSFTTYTDTSFNTAFRTQATSEAQEFAKRVMLENLNPLWAGRITLKGIGTYVAGDLISLTSSSFNLNSQELRITDVSHKLDKSGWFTTLTVEEDPVPVPGETAV